MDNKIRNLYEQMNVMQDKLEDGVRQVRILRKDLRAICPHDFVPGFMFDTCKNCGEER